MREWIVRVGLSGAAVLVWGAAVAFAGDPGCPTCGPKAPAVFGGHPGVAHPNPPGCASPYGRYQPIGCGNFRSTANFMFGGCCSFFGKRPPWPPFPGRYIPPTGPCHYGTYSRY